ncbi:MAG: hypothetical protein WCO60_20205 [Verrucomicrobiota bacterium]
MESTNGTMNGAEYVSRRTYTERPWDRDPFWGGGDPCPLSVLGGKGQIDPDECRRIVAAGIKSGAIKHAPGPTHVVKMKMEKPARAHCTCKVNFAEPGRRLCLDCLEISLSKKEAKVAAVEARRIEREAKVAEGRKGIFRVGYINNPGGPRVKTKSYRKLKHASV